MICSHRAARVGPVHSAPGGPPDAPPPRRPLTARRAEFLRPEAADRQGRPAFDPASRADRLRWQRREAADRALTLAATGRLLRFGAGPMVAGAATASLALSGKLVLHSLQVLLPREPCVDAVTYAGCWVGLAAGLYLFAPSFLALLSAPQLARDFVVPAAQKMDQRAQILLARKAHLDRRVAHFDRLVAAKGTPQA